jgi:hypothetical protein
MWNATRQIVPALAGTFIIHTDRDGGVVAREPVIGWAAGVYGYTRPITARGCRCDIEYDPLIQHPDGTVQDVLGIHKSYDHWLRDLRAEYAMDLATAASSNKPLH